eukprot:Gb_19012 [translate_table: standard]
MDVGNSLLAQMLIETMTPVIMVLPTPLVEAACQKNNLDFVQMLRPFCFYDKIDVPVRTASDQPYRLQKFKLRMFYASEIRQPRVESAEEHLMQVVSNASDKAFAELQGNPEQLEVVHRMAESESLSSWLQVFNKEFIHTLAFSEHEAFDHPVACLLVVSSKDENPVNMFVDLFNTDQLPALLNEGAMDPKILKHYVLIHDNQDGPADKANEILSEMKGTFGVNDCSLLCINSSQIDEELLPEDIWKPYVSSSSVDNTSSQKNLGSFINRSDMEQIKEFMQDLSVKNVIPYLEQKIRSLNQQVSATRKGLKNQIKNLWWRKGKDDTSDVSNGPMYTFSSIESQIRVLGDYAFMLRDYELALSNYRLLSTDYKIDKAWKRYAGVQEMIGLSLFMLDQSRKEAEYCMETAFTTYQKVGVSGQRYATRCALWWAEMHKARGQYKEAANVYFRISSEEPNLRAGVLLEQAAYCYLRANPPMLRKFGFHLVLAGNRYNVCNQRKHAIRAYISVLSVFEGHGWNYINDHVHFNLGRWYGVLGKSDMAIEHFMKLLACSHQSAVTQEAFLGDFLHIVQSLGKKDDILELNLPVINMASLRVHFEDQRTYASPAAACLPEKMWQSLEEGLVPSMPSTITNWLESAAKSPSKSEKIKDSNISIAGEAIELELEFKNPLHIPINVSAVSLICDFISEAMAKEFGSEDNVPGEEESGAELALSGQETRGITGDGKISDCGASSLSLSEEAFTLKGGQSMMVRLKVTPGKEGFLHIVGVKWVLSGTVMGRCDFAPQSPKKKRIKGRNKDSAEYPPHQRLKFAVLKHLPRLEGTIHRVPVKANVGELRRLVLELSNRSGATIKNMKLKINHPRFLIAGELEDLDAEFPVCLEAQEKNKIHVRWPNDDNSDMKAVSGNTIFSFPKDVSLEGGSTLLWPLWLHTGEAGTLSLSISIYYETETPSEDMNYRTLRLHFNVQVLPSLDISVNITPCPSKLQEFLLRLDILNQNISESFWLRQVSSVGMQWKLASLLPSLLENINANEDGTGSNAINTAYLSASVSPSQLLPSGQALSLFFKLVDSTRFTTLEVSGNPVYSKQYNSDVRLGPPSSSEPLIDIASGPLSKFHIEERIVQKTSLVQNSRQCSNDSDSPSTVTQEYGSVDLILIAEQQDEAGNLRLEDLPDAQRISSHHICHCSVKSLCPIWWIMEGPKTVVHDFSSLSFCEIKFCLTIRNCSDVTASIKIETFDNGSVTGQTSDVAHLSAASRNQVGWHDISLETDDTGKPISEPGQGSSIISSNEFPEFHTIVPCSPFMWCSLSSKKITEVGAWSSATVPLSLSVFAPGVFDLSNYRLLWKLHPDENYPQTKREVRSPPTARGDSFHVPRLSSEKDTSTYSAEGTKGPSSGMGLGHPFLLTVLQTT